MRVRVRLDTATDVANFVLIVNDIKTRVFLTNEDGLRVDAKSFLGVAHAREFNKLWCECEEDIYSRIEPFVIVECGEDNAN